MFKNWLSRLYTHGHRRPRRRIRARSILSVEQLETRLTPTAFTWVGGGQNLWETPANWAGGDGKTNYPGWNGTQTTTNDTVTFDNTATTFTCNMDNSHTVSTFT